MLASLYGRARALLVSHWSVYSDAKMTGKGSFTASAAALSELEVHEMTGAIVGTLNALALELGAEDERKEAERRRSLN